MTYLDRYIVVKSKGPSREDTSVGFERCWNMARDMAWRHQHRVEPDMTLGVIGMVGEPGRGGGGDTPLLARQERFRGIVEPVAGFHFDKNQHAAAPRHDVDLTDWAAEAASHDTIALGDQEGRGLAFRREPDAERRDALRPWCICVVIAPRHCRFR